MKLSNPELEKLWKAMADAEDKAFLETIKKTEGNK